MGAVTEHSGFNVLAHGVGGDSNKLFGWLTKP